MANDQRGRSDGLPTSGRPAGLFGLSWPVLGAAGALLVLLILGWSIALSRGGRLETAEQSNRAQAARVAELETSLTQERQA
ncbi:hypothetical protein, partial [Teichococcus vastitatis]